MADSRLIGAAELSAAFQGLGEDIKGKTGARMVVAAGRMVRDAAKTIIRNKGLVRTGTMLRNVAVKRERQVPAGVVQYNVGVRHGRNLGKKDKANSALKLRGSRVVKVYKDDPFYWWHQELGTKHLPAQNMLSLALDNKAKPAVDEMGRILGSDIQKANKT